MSRKNAITLQSSMGKTVSFTIDQLGALSGKSGDHTQVVLKLKVNDENIMFYVPESVEQLQDKINRAARTVICGGPIGDVSMSDADWEKMKEGQHNLTFKRYEGELFV